MRYDGKNPLRMEREELDKLCNEELYSFNHPTKYFEVFFPKFEGKLEVVVAPPQTWEQYNCYAYALDSKKWVERETVEKAIKTARLVETGSPGDGDLAVYYSGNTMKHAGKYFSAGKIQSKWAGGPVFRHEPFFCPATYGDEIKFYKKVTK